MSALGENLEALSTSLPDVPADLASLKAQAERIEREVVDFLNHVGEKDAEAATRLDELKHALAALGQESEGERAQLESQVEAFEARLEAGLGALQDDEARLTEALDGAGTVVQDLKDVVEETSTSARSSEQEATTQLGELQGSVGSGEETLRTAFEVVAAEAAALRDAVEESSQGLKEAVGGVLQRMRDVADQARRRIDETSERLAGLQSAHEAEVPEQRGRVTEEQQEILAHLRERIESELRTRIDASTGAVVAALSSMRDQGLQAAEACKSAHDALEGGFEALREATRPLPPAIEAAKQAAVQVGLTWG